MANGKTQQDIAAETGTRHATFEEIAILSEKLEFPIEDMLGPDAARTYKSIIDRIVQREP